MHSVGAADSCLGASFTCGREITCTYAPLVPTVVLQPDRCSQCVNGRHIRSVAQLNLGIKTPAAGPCLSGASSAVSVWLCASLAVCLLSPVVVASWSVLAAGPVWRMHQAPSVGGPLLVPLIFGQVRISFCPVGARKLLGATRSLRGDPSLVS